MYSELGSGRKEVQPINFSVVIDWKFVFALGAAASGVIIATKMTPEAAENVSIHVVDACAGLLVAGNGN